MNFQILLCRNHSIGSWFLRACMWSRYSHSAILDVDTGQVYDSTLWQGGVKVKPMAEFEAHYPVVERRDCPVAAENVPHARQWLAAQLGKRYDWTALVSFIVHRDWAEDDSWFCSEMSEAFRSIFSTPRFRAEAWRVTPHHQDMVV